MTKKDKWLLREFLECQKRNNREVSVIAPLNGSIIVTGKIGKMCIRDRVKAEKVTTAKKETAKK